ncbi:MAG: LPS export ABC transporter periplasmic protein LptC [Bacteroidales bacterium]|nr:LPS export ABC transporter periplasmic protein LptC [Bacteroidales bacterium]
MATIKNNRKVRKGFSQNTQRVNDSVTLCALCIPFAHFAVKKTFKTLLALSAALLLFLPLFFTSCRNDLQDIARIQIPDTVAGQFITNGELYYSELGRTKVRVQSPVINNYESGDGYTELPEGFHAEFLDENMEVESTITAEYGVVLRKENIMRARRDVVVLSLKDNEQLNTEELTWDMNAKKIYTDAFVKMTSADKILFGDGFEADENFENRTIKKLRGEILVKKDEEE